MIEIEKMKRALVRANGSVSHPESCEWSYSEGGDVCDCGVWIELAIAARENLPALFERLEKLEKASRFVLDNAECKCWGVMSRPCCYCDLEEALEEVGEG